MSRVNYDLEVFCSGCEQKYLKETVEFKYGYGYKCPDCGIKCRYKARDAGQTYVSKIGQEEKRTYATTYIKEKAGMVQSC